jgi:hypothetical protein
MAGQRPGSLAPGPLTPAGTGSAARRRSGRSSHWRRARSRGKGASFGSWPERPPRLGIVLDGHRSGQGHRELGALMACGLALRWRGCHPPGAPRRGISAGKPCSPGKHPSMRLVSLVGQGLMGDLGSGPGVTHDDYSLQCDLHCVGSGDHFSSRWCDAFVSSPRWCDASVACLPSVILCCVACNIPGFRSRSCCARPSSSPVISVPERVAHGLHPHQ